MMYCEGDQKRSKENKKQKEITSKEKVKDNKKDSQMIYDYDKQNINLKLNIKNVDKKIVERGLGALQEIKIEYDDSSLSENEKRVLQLCTEAAKYIDRAFFTQVFSANVKVEKELFNQKSPIYNSVKDFFRVCYGPFDYNTIKAFIDLGEIKNRLKGANFYQ